MTEDARLMKLEQRMTKVESRLELMAKESEFTAHKIDGLREFFAAQISSLKESLDKDRAATKGEFDDWRDNTRWVLRTIAGALISMVVLGLGGLIWLGFMTKVQADEYDHRGTAALIQPLGAYDDHTGFTLGADRGSPIPDRPITE